MISVLPGLLSKQRAVAQGLEREDRRAPVDAVVLLGDNFYPDGLHPETLAAQVRVNVVRPYCRFLAFEAPRASEVEGACPLPAAERRAVPFLVVLGNHDYDTPASPGLQVEAVPQLVSNWRSPRALAEVVSLGEGLDLVLVDSVRIARGADTAPLRAALAQARGPFRVLVMHHPMALASGQERDPQGVDMRHRETMLGAVAESGVPVQLVLAGHEHNLQVLEMARPAPPLHVVSGGGSSPGEVAHQSAEQRLGLNATVFARVDLVRRDGEDRLAVSLFVTAQRPPFAHGAPRRVALYSVDAAGAVRDEGTAR
jgi:hypothetical protein